MEKIECYCRLCFYKTDNSLFMIDIYSQKEYSYKIKQFLHLKTEEAEENGKISKLICLNCSQSLDVFNCFYEKIHKVQKAFLNQEYENQLIKFKEPSTSCLEERSSIQPNSEVEFQIINLISETQAAESIPIIESYEIAKSSESTQVLGEIIDIKIEEIQSQKSNEKSIRETIKRKRQTENSSCKVPKKDKQKLEVAFEKLKSKQTTILPTLSQDTSVNNQNTVESECESEEEAGLMFYKQEPNEDGENDAWMASDRLSNFPKQIIKNGLLTLKGQNLRDVVDKFYNLDCTMCEEKTRFKSVKCLFDHYSKVHSLKGFVMCCQKKFNLMPSIVLHMARHLQPEAFSCSICGYQVTRPKFLEHHKRSHLPEDKYSCDYCEKTFCWKGTLQVHLMSHLPKSERKVYACQICDKNYANPGSLSTHKRLIHRKIKSERIMCEMCPKSFNSKNALHEHVKMSHDEGRDKFQIQCKDCGKWLKNQRCLKNHMLLHSNQDLQCELCRYTTKKQSLLKKHKIMHHSDEKNYICLDCGKSFKLKRLLTVHMARHSDVKKLIKCNFCDRTFANSTNFYTHRKNLHFEELQEMKTKELEEQRRKRIEAGLEKADNHNLGKSNLVFYTIANPTENS